MASVLPLMAGASSLFATGAVLYKCIRPRFPVKVNCHFCNTDTQVPYGNQNCWDCPTCEQYNGFALNGDYNKPIPAQYAEEMNHPISAEQRQTTELKTNSVLCDQCARNQLLKVKQLSNFVSYEESNYDAEVEAYQSHLEHVYRLCRACEKKVDRCIRKQDDVLHRKLLESGTPPRPECSDQHISFQGPQYCILPTTWYIKLMRVSVFLCACVILIANTHNLARKSEFAWMPQGALQEMFSLLADDIYTWSWYLVCTALFLNTVAIALSGKESLAGLDTVSCFLWLALVALHSEIIEQWLPLWQVYRLQPPLTLLAVSIGLWSALSPRYRRAASPKRIRTRRLRPDSSYASSASSSPGDVTSQYASSEHQSQSPLSQYAPSEPDQDREAEPATFVPLDELETLSIGEPITINERGLFNQHDRIPVNPLITSNGVNQFRQPRPIISPARFRASVARTFARTSPSPRTNYVRQHSFGLPKNSNNSNRTGEFRLQRELFQSATSRLDDSLITNRSSLTFDDRASLFSEPRQRRQSDGSNASSSSDSHVSESKASTQCPVDTTFSEVQQPDVKAVSQKQRVMTSLIWGLSIGLNICLLLYLFVDQNSWAYIARLFL